MINVRAIFLVVSHHSKKFHLPVNIKIPMLPNANLSCKNLDSLSTELHALYNLKDKYPVLCGGCFGVGEINLCSTKVTALTRSTEIFIMGLWYRAFQLGFVF